MTSLQTADLFWSHDFFRLVTKDMAVLGKHVQGV
jgi:hypothetical protein